MTPLQPEKCYHLFNHANGNENLFITDDNYNFFLKRYTHYISPIANTFAYCLMPNHFHYLVQIKDEVTIRKHLGLENNISDPSLESSVSKQFSNLFNSYTKSFNVIFDRKGSLFQQNFKRKEVENDDYFLKLIHYIHANPVHHGFVNAIEDWPFSSYNSILSNKSTLLSRNELLDWFDGREDFINYHKQPIDLKLYLELD